MNFLNRAIRSVMRQFGKNIILLLLIFILVSIISGAILVEGAIGATEANLRRRMPSIVSIGVDEDRLMEEYHLTGVFPRAGMVTADFVREIGELPYVRDFNYSISEHLYSFDLRSYGFSQPRGRIDFFDLTGISNANLPHIEEGFIEVVDGRMMTDDEINVPNDHGIVPTFISSSLAELNQLQIGSVFTLSCMIFDHSDPFISNYTFFSEENLFTMEDFQFEIVGLFDTVVDREAELEAANDSMHEFNIFERHVGILNQIFVPNYVAAEITRFRIDAYNKMDSGNRSVSISVSSLFLLEDPLYIENFRAAVEPLLPNYIGIADFSHAFDTVSSSMEMFRQIADQVLWTVVGATLIILTLLITLFLRDRRYEMGIYLALGEKKIKIVAQILLEVVVVAAVGITLAVFAGNVALSEISQVMLRNELVESRNAESNFAVIPGSEMGDTVSVTQTITTVSDTNSLSGMGRGFTFELMPEELVEQFELSLSTGVVLLIYGVGSAVVVAATLVSVVYIIRLNPKKVLM